MLVGEHQHRPDFPPTLHAALLMERGLRPWVTLDCRDRNRVILEQDLVGLREIDVPGVLCVTGLARGPGVRSGVTQVERELARRHGEADAWRTAQRQSTRIGELLDEGHRHPVARGPARALNPGGDRH